MMKPQRPTGISILAILDFLVGALVILGGLFLVAVGGSGLLTSFGYGIFSGVVSVVGGFALLIGIFAIVVGWGMWTGKEWAWILALILYGLGALTSLVSLVGGGVSSLVSLLIDAFLIWYLFRPHVRAFFGKGMAQPPVAPMATPPPQTTT